MRRSRRRAACGSRAGIFLPFLVRLDCPGPMRVKGAFVGPKHRRPGGPADPWALDASTKMFHGEGGRENPKTFMQKTALGARGNAIAAINWPDSASSEQPNKRPAAARAAKMSHGGVTASTRSDLDDISAVERDLKDRQGNS